MNEMVERVAVAIFEAMHRGRPHADLTPDDIHKNLAIAAIKAMHRPTNEMTNSGSNIEITRPGNDDTNSTSELTPGEACTVWMVMIDEALK